MTPNLESKIVPARGAKGSNQAIIRQMALDPAKWVKEGGKMVLKGASKLLDSRSKANSFYSSARKLGLGMIRRSEEHGTRVWVVEKEKK